MNAVIWPANIDSEKSRAAGRKISVKNAVPSPTIGEIKDAAKSLGLSPKLEKEKAYPREWWGKKGRVIVNKKKPKTLILNEISGEIKRGRS